MYEYKIVKPESVWKTGDTVFEDIFNKHASQGWRVKNVAFNQSGNFTKAVLERNKNRV
ncbi:DUF4177 domain-containing protein [Lutibacter sp. TH_r2]|uniref:DUF4177 domain-containing protein n=1 Tax=Lutibacter sp. TH_r2 TaxID=3082083 RepID=UPI0029538F49|nr:DUF4177 domain-containing protein [Lutibacter sp. TH_r2]MDV7185706.1 DUF4177 domain-containing protein [Lutibacter sp. TH_r2]